ncbi:MAG: 3-isopropylmalate dehydratase small subunit [Desulfobulbaceae bacterium]|nr:MAG: 3-isopropylmalate dehydratase small subunit [Desulfobulbaceae bacterium]
MDTNKIIVKEVSGTVLPLKGNDIDTDRIIPARFLRSITFEGLGEQVFCDERFDQAGNPLDHPFNHESYRGAKILVVNQNFGCGSSREHAPQAIMRFGIEAIIGESFAEIFAGNCTSLGIPVLTASIAEIEALQAHAQENPSEEFVVDISHPHITYGARTIALQINDAAKQALLNGTWDSLETLLQERQNIAATAAKLPYISSFPYPQSTG